MSGAPPSDRLPPTGAVPRARPLPPTGAVPRARPLPPTGAVLHAHPLPPGPGRGAGRPLVALHGVRGHGRRWPFLAGRSGYGLDLRGHGRSTYEPPWTLEQHAADVIATVADLGLTGFDLVGISFGGAVALHVASAAPELVHRLVLLDPVVAVDPALALERARAATPAPAFADRAEARAVRALIWDGAASQVVDDEVAAHLARSPDGLWRWRYEPGAVVAAFSEAARPLPDPLPRTPTLVVEAAHGSVLGPPAIRALRDHGCRTQVIDAGHGMDIEAPDAVADLVTRFLEERTERPTP
ncbi:alpha/beta fold hydrolase [Streptomyces sp. NPDC018610]|uniref:alpha/beta fold hydrolase n=1 Tax=Streptomyces sp. NPDC018610 TaxID=3365049 RepID=UPI00378EDA19